MSLTDLDFAKSPAANQRSFPKHSQIFAFSRGDCRTEVGLIANTRLSSHSLRIMHEILVELGIDPAVLMARAGIDSTILSDPWSTLQGSQELGFQRLFQQATHHIPGLWYETGCRYRALDYGFLGLAALTSATISDALRIFVELQSLGHGLFQYDITETDGCVISCEANPQYAPKDMREFLHERFLGGAPTFLQDLRQEKVPIDRIESVLDRPKGWNNLEETWDTEILYGAVRTKIHLSPGAGALPLPMANVLVAENYRRTCLSMIRTIPARPTIASAIYQLLLQRRAPFPTAAEAASRVNLSERSLHRKLAEQGSSYQDILDDVRLRRAQDLLNEPRLSMAEISEHLGFAEMTSFTRFFRRLTGTPPLAYRRRYRGLSAQAR